MNDENKILLPEELITDKIYFIRGHKVIIDNNLAKMYGVETKQLKRQVNRNKERFPEDFMFELTKTEFEILRCQFGTFNTLNNRYLPYAFTEQGVAMLSSVLNSKQAIRVNIQIIRVFTRLRQILHDNTELRLAIEEIRKKTENNTQNIELVFKYLDELLDKKENPKPITQIGFKT
jgi:hypothetical protein